MSVRRLLLGALFLVAGTGDATAQPKPVTWTQQRIEAVVRVDIRYAGYSKPATSTGFLVKGLRGYYVLATDHALQNEYSTSKLAGTGCVALTGATLVLTRGEAAPEALKHQGCAIFVGMDLVLIPVEDRPEGYPTLRVVARTIQRYENLHLAGFANGYAALDTVSEGPVSLLDVPPDSLGVAHLLTSAGMSGGPLLDDDGEVVGVHRGDLYLSPGYAHFARVEKARPVLEPMLGPISTQVGSTVDPARPAAIAAQSARIGDLLALSGLTLADRVQAWSSYQARPVTIPEKAFLRAIPRQGNEALTPTTSNRPESFKAEVASLIASNRDRAIANCRRDQKLIDGYIECAGQRVFLPGVEAGALIKPELIMLHFAAATDLSGVISYFASQGLNATVHFVIDRDGTLVQLVPADRRASHAGNGNWQGEGRLNSRSIGIEFMNAGALQRRDDGTFATAYGNQQIPENEVLPIKVGDRIEYWHRYTAAQVETAERLAKTLANTYAIKDIIGHCNVTTRKVDPGPAFPSEAFAQSVLGHSSPPCGYADSVGTSDNKKG